jgi:hypothetical protein
MVGTAAFVLGLFLLVTLVGPDIGPLSADRTVPIPAYVEPLVPTPLPGMDPMSRPFVGEAGEPRVQAVTPSNRPLPNSLRWRVGVGIPDRNPLYFDWPTARPGWYLSWSLGLTQTLSTTTDSSYDAMGALDHAALGMEFMPMVRMREGQLQTEIEFIAEMAARYPGRTWLIGNEPDVLWQDNTTPEQYAQAYHQAFNTIKEADPTATIAIAGLSQITPLRLNYLDRVLRFYRLRYGEEMPVDVWNMHAFVLREESANWGVSIPPGFRHVRHGVLWQVDDHDDLLLIENQVRLMRKWMEKNSQRNKPLIITEYGILMPPGYGFPPRTVIGFMKGSFELFDSLRDAELGYTEDDNRLVQRWTWFSTYYDLYPTGNLFYRSGTPTALMDALSAYLDTNDVPQ